MSNDIAKHCGNSSFSVSEWSENQMLLVVICWEQVLQTGCCRHRLKAVGAYWHFKAYRYQPVSLMTGDGGKPSKSRNDSLWIVETFLTGWRNGQFQVCSSTYKGYISDILSTKHQSRCRGNSSGRKNDGCDPNVCVCGEEGGNTGSEESAAVAEKSEWKTICLEKSKELGVWESDASWWQRSYRENQRLRDSFPQSSNLIFNPCLWLSNTASNVLWFPVGSNIFFISIMWKKYVSCKTQYPFCSLGLCQDRDTERLIGG